MTHDSTSMPPDSIREKALETLIQLAKPKRIWLFGSRARQDSSSGSDYDFALEGPALSEGDRWRIHEALEALPTLRSFDIVWLEAASDTLKERILSEGVCLYER